MIWQDGPASERRRKKERRASRQKVAVRWHRGWLFPSAPQRELVRKMKRESIGAPARACGSRGDYFAFCLEGAMPCRKMARARTVSRPRSGNLVFHLSRRPKADNLFRRAWRARPQKPETTRSSWLTAARRRKDDDGDDRVVTMRFCRSFIHAKTRLPRIQFFTGAFRMSLVTTHGTSASPQTNRGGFLLNRSTGDKNIYFHATLSSYGFVSDSFSFFFFFRVPIL